MKIHYSEASIIQIPIGKRTAVKCGFEESLAQTSARIVAAHGYFPAEDAEFFHQFIGGKGRMARWKMQVKRSKRE